MLSKTDGEVVVHGSMYLSFKANPTSSSDKAVYSVQNLGRAIVNEKHLKINGRSATIINDHGECKLYTDLWYTKAEWKHRILLGIQEPLELNHRIDAKKTAQGADVENVTDEQKAITKTYSNTFYISLDDEQFNNVSPFCPYFIKDNVTIEMKLAEAKDVVLSSVKCTSYEMSDLKLEWDAIQDSTLAQGVAANYQTGWSVHYDRVQFLRKESYPKSSTLINVNIRESRCYDSLQGPGR